MNLHPLVVRGKHCGVEKQELIKSLIKSGKIYKELVGCSATMIHIAIIFKKWTKKGI